MRIGVLLSFGAVFLATGCGPLGSSLDPEKESDFAPGFFSAEEDTTAEDRAGGEINGDLPVPDQIDVIEAEDFAQKLSFAQTKWNECTARMTGNYETYACVAGRNISVILDSYLQNRLIACVDAGMAAQNGGGTAKRLHITHAGITADARHSPKSLHSVNRAIDVKLIRATLTNGEERQYTYSKIGNRPFYTELRKCWGKVVHDFNGCPYYSDNQMHTGSIGWENADHGRHMHLSVPYCVNGSYGSGLWVR